jgi:hypothetical protein
VHATPNLVIFPLHKGTSHGETVYYVITESSDPQYANTLGVNPSPKLANAKGTPAVQMVTGTVDTLIDFPATVTFGLAREIAPGGPTGFPPADGASPPAMGEPDYSPLIELPNGTVLNAPQIANDTGHADKVVSQICP